MISLRTLNRFLILTTLGCGLAMILGAVGTLSDLPPIPEQVEDEAGNTVFTKSDIEAGKEVFHKYNLMSYGSFLGNGAYYGPDFTAEYLDLLAGDISSNSTDAVSKMRHAQIENGVLTLPSWWIDSHNRARDYYARFYVTGNTAAGVGPETIRTVDEAHRFADFVGWAAWFCIADKQGQDGSYTNNWPYEPRLGNIATPANLFWSTATIAIVLLLAAMIALAFKYAKVESIPELPVIESPGQQPVLSSQRAVIPLFLIAAILFVVQTLAGGYIANSFASRMDFYGLFDALGLQRAVVLPFAAIRAIHVDLGVLWIIGMWMSASLFVAPLLGAPGRPWLKGGVRLLTSLLVITIAGGVVGLYLSSQNVLGDLWFWIGTEGWEYVDTGRLWKIGIALCFAIWVGLLLASYGSMLTSSKGHLHRVLVGIGIGISAAFLPSLFFVPGSHFVMSDFWRWWTVHLWVEGIFAFFQIAVLATVFHSLKLVDLKTVTKSLYLEGALVIVAGSLAIGHHYWWVGESDLWLSVGSIFSSLEVVPLFMLLLQALKTYRSTHQSPETAAHSVALLFLIASAVWQFIGSGVLGLILNLPIINYYEHGTYLTVAHAHGSFLGGFGFVAIGLMLYALRFVVSDSAWPRRAFQWSFYLLNAGLAMMLLVSVIPVGMMQLTEAFSSTFHASRELAFYQQTAVQMLMKLRMPGDTLIILGAALLALASIRATWRSRKA